ncbi:MAG TPA: VTT domain-containing protein, partial [Burkholderiales bacterium]
VLGGLLVMPVTLLVAATALAFGPVFGLVYSVLGAMASAAVVYGLGRWLGRDVVRRFAGARLNAVSRRLAQRGILTIMFVRVVPVAPFSVVNLVAGASHIGFRDFLLGTLFGMTPGIALIALFVDQVGQTLRQPGPGAVALLAALLALIVGASYGLRRLASRRKPGAAESRA